MKKDFDLNLHAYRLLQEEPFFAALSRKVEKQADPSINARVSLLLYLTAKCCKERFFLQ